MCVLPRIGAGMSSQRHSNGAHNPRLSSGVADMGNFAVRLSLVAGLFAAVIALVALINLCSVGQLQAGGWGSFVKMRPKSALGVLTASLSLMLLTRHSWRTIGFPLAWGLALVPLAIGLLTIGEYAG